jgi:hypothetical protein
MTERRELLPAALALDAEPFSDAELDNVLTHPDDDVAKETNAGRFEVLDARSAEWTMRKLAGLQVEIAERLQEADWYATHIEQWKEQETKPLIRRARHFENLLADYAYRIRQKTDAAVKSISLPSGEISTRGKDGAVKIVLTDREEFMRWVDTVVPTFAEKLFARLEPRPITEIREHVKLARVPGHRHITFDDGCEIDVAHDGTPIDELEEGEGVSCPVCGGAGRVIRYVDEIGEHFRIEVDFDSEDPMMVEAATTSFFSWMTDRPVPGLDVQPDEITVTVKPHV